MGPDSRIADNFGGKTVRILLLATALLYFTVLLLDRFNRTLANAIFPTVVVFFAQISGLFPTSVTTSIDYRAEGWLCREHRYVELDMDPLFPMLADNKENRFHRVMHFFRQERTVLRALDTFIVARSPTIQTTSGLDRIGGVRLLSLRIPLPKSRIEVERFRRLPLSEYPREYRKHWYWTPRSIRDQRCGDA